MIGSTLFFFVTRSPFGTIRWTIPRLVCVLPAPESWEAPLQECDRNFEQWSAVLTNWCRGGKEKGKGWGTRKLRVFFLCSYDMSLAECGPGGQGYEVSSPMKAWSPGHLLRARLPYFRSCFFRPFES